MKSIKDYLIIARSPLIRIGLKNRDFSIISNNCWGGVVSRDRFLPYNSPTVGLLFFSDDYIQFLSNLKYYLSAELVEMQTSESKYKAYLFPKYGDNLVMGRIDDVEIVFLHYNSFCEAKDKWERRCKRVNFNNLLVKFGDQNHFTTENFKAFKDMDFDNKLFLTVDESLNSEFTYVIPDKWHCGYAVDDILPSFKVININKLLNNLNRK